MDSPDLSPVGAKFGTKDEKRFASSSTTLAVVPESDDVLPPPATAHTGPVALQDFDPSVGAKPSSPFYKHATPSVSMAKLKATKNARAPCPDNLYDQDVESGGAVIDADADTTRTEIGGDGSHRESKLWAQRKRRWGFMHSLSRRQRLVLKAIIAIGTLGSMMAIALGITAAVGGGVWRSDHQHRLIG